MSKFVLAACAFVILGVSQACGQTYWHADGNGYSIRAGNTVFNQRNAGYGPSSTHIYSGNTQFHNYSNGTQGTTIYGSQGRFDNFSNPQQGWSGSGYTPYQNQYTQPWGYGGSYRRR